MPPLLPPNAFRSDDSLNSHFTGGRRISTFRRQSFAIIVKSIVYSLLVLLGINVIFRLPLPAKPSADPLVPPHVQTQLSKLPLHFESNQGQLSNDILFLARGVGYALTLRKQDAQLHLSSGERNTTVTMKLRGANPNPHISGEAALPGRTNYFRGNDARQWQTDIQNYAQVHYANVYRGIDAVYYGQQEKLEYDFIVAPQADPLQIRLVFERAQALHLDGNGNLLLQTKGGEIRQQRPVVYQDTDQGRKPVGASYVI